MVVGAPVVECDVVDPGDVGEVPGDQGETVVARDGSNLAIGEWSAGTRCGVSRRYVLI
jgi:hypothetical protein